MDITWQSNVSIEDDTSSSSSSPGCSLNINYYDEEFYCYLFIMCPLALVGILLNLVSLKVFSDKSFNTVTFKYLRLITLTDCFICCIIIPYCITSYTQPFSRHDLFGRQVYLAYIYIPGANFAINLSMLLNLLVTLERLISVGWPTRKYKLFKPSRYYLSCVLVIAISLVLNLMNFFMYKIGQCDPSSSSSLDDTLLLPPSQKLTKLQPRSFVLEKWWMMYGYVKEVLTRVLPILVLILLNIMLIYIVRSSRERMKESRGGGTGVSKHLLQQQQQKGESPTRTTQSGGVFCCSFGKKSSDDGGTDEAAAGEGGGGSGGTNSRRSTVPNTNLVLQSKKNRQENQLTIMTIVVAVLYIVTSIPMVFAYPGLVFTDMESKAYKMYAVLVNILELIQCSFRFVIYFCFTTQFRQVLYKMFEREQQQQQPQRERALSAATIGLNAVNNKNTS